MWSLITPKDYELNKIDSALYQESLVQIGTVVHEKKKKFKCIPL
jgi:hypothetical protein